jgi:peroxiredoxin
MTTAEETIGPQDDAYDHLVGIALPELRLESTVGPVDLAELPDGPLVLFIYPHATGRPDAPVPGWDQIPGARGCTAQSCAFRDAHDRFRALGATVAGLSVQTADEQREFAARVGLRFSLISDPERELAAALALPTFIAGGRTFYKRLTLIAAAGRIVKIFYPVVPPERNPSDVLSWLESERARVRSRA